MIPIASTIVRCGTFEAIPENHQSSRITICPQYQGASNVIEIVNGADTTTKRLAQAGLEPMTTAKPLPPIVG